MVTPPRWDGHDLAELLALEPSTPMQFRNRLVDPNVNDRVYGGQLLAQAIFATAQTVPAGRGATALQFLFLQGAMNNQALEFGVAALQDGKRFSSRHVRGTQQGGRVIFDAQVSFAVPFAAPAHSVAPPASMPGEDPETFPGLDELPADWGPDIDRALRYPTRSRAVLDLRFPDYPERMYLDPRAPQLRYWIKVRQGLPDDPHLHSAAFAYLSDWWMNYAAMGGHLKPLVESQRVLYLASLNHAIWFHQPVRADEWLHFDCTSPAAADGRGLAIARVHDRAGRLVASVTQECLMSLQV